MMPFSEFFLTKTKSELLERAIQDRFMIAPLCSMDELLSDPQLAARESWCQVEVAGRQFRIASAPVRFDSISWRSPTCLT